ncbi:MAG: CapA family protein [Deltaproteobacteria bacterium]|nr:CapA family protein [Deltaproteobacteria bacterium]
MTQALNTLTLIAGGDVGPVMEPVDRLAELVLPVLRQADFRVAQSERTYSERGWYQEWKTTIPSGKHSRQEPKMASLFQKAGIDVISLASNHVMDWGYEPMLDTIDLFRNMGMQVIGAGRNAEEARRPAVLEKNGVKVAILGYCSVLRDGQAAGDRKPGIAPMRASTYYEPVDFQPGSPPNIITVPLEEDIAAMREDIERAKAAVDSVIIFIHWGIRLFPKIVAAYQPPVAHAAIDAGADLILGHHSHVPKAVEVYKGKVCFYSIGNFLTNGSHKKRPEVEKNMFISPLWYQVEVDSLYCFPIHCKQTILPKIVFSKRGVERVSFLPALINELAQPEVLDSKDPRFQEVVQTMEWVSDFVPHKFRVEGNEVVVEQPQ